MINIDNAKPLKIPNENNKLELQNFTVIHFAPARAGFNKNNEFVKGVIEEDFNRVYVIDHDGKQLYVKLKDFTRIRFSEISTAMTMPCSGMESFSWKVDFMTRYPNTTMATELAIYEYERVQ